MKFYQLRCALLTFKCVDFVVECTVHPRVCFYSSDKEIHPSCSLYYTPSLLVYGRCHIFLGGLYNIFVNIIRLSKLMSVAFMDVIILATLCIVDSLICTQYAFYLNTLLLFCWIFLQKYFFFSSETSLQFT